MFGKPSLTEQKIANILGVSRSNISRYLSSGVAKLKALSLNEKDLTDEQLLLKYRLIENGPNKEIEKYF